MNLFSMDVIREQLSRSEIDNVDQRQYCAVAQWLQKEFALEPDCLPIWVAPALEQLSVTRAQRGKAKWIIQLLSDYQQGKASIKPAPLDLDCDVCGAPCTYQYKHRGGRYCCTQCTATVGTHNGDCWPLGSLATAETKKLRVSVHDAVDPIWKEGVVSRRELYRRIAYKLGLLPHESHIGWIVTPEQARRFVEAALAVSAEAKQGGVNAN